MQLAIDFVGSQPSWMKLFLVLVILTALVWLILAVGYYRETTRTAHLPQGATALSQPIGNPLSPTPPNTSPDGHAAPASLNINAGQLLVLSGPDGVSVVELSFHEDCKASYRWRHSKTPGSQESFGGGELFEQYGTDSPPDSPSRQITDLGGKLLITAGPYSIAWSCGGADKGFVYPKTSGVRAHRVDDKSFDAFRL